MKNKLFQIALAAILCATLWSCEKVTKTDDGWVDLGLPSGLLWASCNVGAENPQDYGDYFAWGETKPKANYTEASYNCRDIYDGSNDWANKLFSIDDAATVNIGAPARMPTKEDFEELYNCCESEWISYKGKNGRIFKGPNGNSIFLPAAGELSNTSLKNVDKYGNYWSSNGGGTSEYWYENLAMYLFFNEDFFTTDAHGRWTGQSVRPVKEYTD